MQPYQDEDGDSAQDEGVQQDGIVFGDAAQQLGNLFNLRINLLLAGVQTGTLVVHHVLHLADLCAGRLVASTH